MATRRDSRPDPIANRMMRDPFFQSDAEQDVMQVDASDLVEEVYDEGVDESAYAEEATTVFSEDQVRGFMDEGTLDEEIEEVSEDDEHTAIYDPGAHAPAPAPSRTLAMSPAPWQAAPAPAPAPAPRRTAAIPAQQPAPRPVTAPVPAVRSSASQANAAARARQNSQAQVGVAPVATGSSPSISAPIPRQRPAEGSGPRSAYQEEATIVTDGAAFRAAAERMNPSLAPARVAVPSGTQQIVATPQPAAPPRGGWSGLQVVLAVVLTLALGAVGVLAWQLANTEAPAAAARGTLWVVTTPAGATVHVGSEVQPRTTPMVIDDLPLNEPLALMVELAGHTTLTEVVTLASAEPVQREFTLQAEVGTIVVNTVPPGAMVYVNGEEKGVAPQTVTGLDRTRSWALTATLDAHQPASQTVRWEAGAPAEQTVVLALTPLVPVAAVADADAGMPADTGMADAAVAAVEAPAPAPAPVAQAPAARTPAPAPAPARTETAPVRERPSARTDTAPAQEPAAAAPTRRERPSARPSGETAAPAAPTPAPAEEGEATISVQAVPYGQVWIDGRMVARETPLLNHTLPSGTHRVKVYFESLRQFSDERTIRLEAGASQSITFRAPR